ncbi:MAG TPA: DNA polymerase I [Cyclobacteriaceae bacterium]|nr:DNA polymerase I [Cyclobacteriaceae bacterium]
MTEQKTLFLLDAYALIYRAHFAFTKNPRINSKGRNTSVPFGFTNSMLEVIQKKKPAHIAVAFDTAEPTFRDEIFEDYKATRQESPEDVSYGTPIVKEIIKGFNIPILEYDGYEADDIIGTIAKKAVKEGFKVFMMTPDKDFGQLVEEDILLYKPAYMGNAVDVLGPKEVCEKWDIEQVDQVRDMLGLQGDASDNIPGVPGIGPKTAATLLKKYGSIEEIVKHADELKGKQKELMTDYAEQALLSKKLATIVTDAPVEFDEEALRYTGPDAEKLKPIFHELEFKTLANRIFGESNTSTAPPAKAASQLSMFEAAATEEKREEEKPSADIGSVMTQYHLIDSAELADELCQYLLKQKAFAFDVATDNAPNFDYSLHALSISYNKHEAYFIPLEDKKSAKDILNALAPAFQKTGIAKAGYNIKPAMLALKKADVEVEGPYFDALLAHYLIEPESSHDLGIISNQYLNYTLMPEGNDLHDWLCERADICLQLKTPLEKEIEKRKHSKLLHDIEMPLVKVLADMEFEGVKVDTAVLAEMSESLKTDSEKVQQEIYKLSGVEFNIASPKQLGEVLFEKLKLIDKPKKTKSGQYATGEEIMAKLAAEHIIAQKILEFREMEKLRSTYVDALPKMISQFDGRIHTDYRQAVAATGRLSSNNPNLQNIPVRTEKGRQIRKAFVARDKDYLFMSADYSQIELRIVASLAKDQSMIDAFKNKRDIHATTAAKVFKVDLKDVTPDMRRKAKEVNFGIIYGSSAFGLAQNLNITRTEAAEIIEAYWKEFPSIRAYMDNAIEKAREQEYVETITGRRRYLRDINSRNFATRSFAERNAINAPIQGSAADIIKLAMVHIHEWLMKEKLKTKMIMQVHDELVFDLHREEEVHVKKNITKLMEAAAQLEVPMQVEVGVGKNWLEAH